MAGNDTTAISIDVTVEAADLGVYAESVPLLAHQCPDNYYCHYQTTNDNRSVQSYGSFDSLRGNGQETESDIQTLNFSQSNTYSSERCSVISSYSSTYYYEAKPHLCDVRVFTILFILIVGITIASYLLIVETRLPALGFTLDLVSHDIWSKLTIPESARLNDTKISNILILHTATSGCYTSNDCVQLLKKFQHQQWTSPFEMPFNFLIGSDELTYEVRGWDTDAEFLNSTEKATIVVGFIGNYTKNLPPTKALKSALSLIKESVRRKKLLPNYRIYGLRNVTLADNDAEAMLHYIQHWPHFAGSLNVN